MEAIPQNAVMSSDHRAAGGPSRWGRGNGPGRFCKNAGIRLHLRGDRQEPPGQRGHTVGQVRDAAGPVPCLLRCGSGALNRPEEGERRRC